MFVLCANAFWSLRLVSCRHFVPLRGVVGLSVPVMSNRGEKRLNMDEGSGTSVQRKRTSPKKTCNLSTQKFIDIIDTAAFVDKSLFIKAFLKESNGMILTLAPRKFGKSTNMDMLKEFLSGNKELFEKNQLKIWKEERAFFDKNCQKNPIIHVDFSSIGGKTKDEILGSIKETIQNAYDNHKYLVRKVEENWTWSDEKLKKVDFTAETFMNYWKNSEALSRVDVTFGFEYLSECLYVYYDKPVYVLIDEYDAPIMEAIMITNLEPDILEGTINLISSMMSSFLKGNKYVKRALINACLPVGGAVISGDANNIKYYEFLSPLSFVEYYGFTAQEVQDLFEREEFVSFRNDDAIRQWYNGYQIRNSDTAIYNNYSILQYLDRSREQNKQTFGSYWVGIPNMKALFAKCGIRKLVEKLINGEEIGMKTVARMHKEDVEIMKALVHGNSNKIYSGSNMFYQFLAYNGYLNVIEHNKDPYNRRSMVKVPNEEIKTLLRQECYNAGFLEDKYDLNPEKIHNYIDAIYSVLEERNENAFIRLASAVSDLFDKCKIPIDEVELHFIMFTLVYNVKLYHTRGELSVERIKRQLGSSHLDILVIHGCVGMIIELKSRNESSEKAYEQIKTAGYSAVFDKPEYKNITNKILLGLHMDVNKKVSITYTVDDTPKKSITDRE